MHRCLSTCLYDPIEAVSSCAPPPPPDTLPVHFQDAPMHTAKILQAAEKLTNMLTMPVSMAKHTPFSICMIATTIIGYLSACKYTLKDEKLNLARERIRVAMGALDAFGEVWLGAKRTATEVKTVAHHMLNLEAVCVPETTPMNLAISGPLRNTSFMTMTDNFSGTGYRILSYSGSMVDFEQDIGNIGLPLEVSGHQRY
jgi:hypothetical protein